MTWYIIAALFTGAIVGLITASLLAASRESAEVRELRKIIDSKEFFWREESLHLRQRFEQSQRRVMALAKRLDGENEDRETPVKGVSKP